MPSPEFENLWSMIDRSVNHFHQQQGLSSCVYISDLWFNINYYKDYNDTHCHPFNKIAGVFYVSCPKNCGDIVFKNPTLMDSFYKANEQSKFTEYNSSSWYMPAEENALYLFPAWLYHKVRPNLSKQPRISFSFNVD